MIIRKMCRGEIRNVDSIEQRCFPNPWDREIFQRMLNNRSDYTCIVASNGCLMGYAIFRNHTHFIRIVRVAVLPEVRRMGIGSALVEYGLSRLDDVCWRLRATVFERDMPTIRFFLS